MTLEGFFVREPLIKRTVQPVIIDLIRWNAQQIREGCLFKEMLRTLLNKI